VKNSLNKWLLNGISLVLLMNTIKEKDMKAQEINIANALLTAKEVLVQMLAQGFGDTKYVFALSNMLVKKFNLTQEESIIVIENALPLTANTTNR
jgi:hypothetical protein